MVGDGDELVCKESKMMYLIHGEMTYLETVMSKELLILCEVLSKSWMM